MWNQVNLRVCGVLAGWRTYLTRLVTPEGSADSGGGYIQLVDPFRRPIHYIIRLSVKTVNMWGLPPPLPLPVIPKGLFNPSKQLCD